VRDATGVPEQTVLKEEHLMDIRAIILKGKRWIWIAMALALAGGVAGWIYAGRIVPTPFAVVTLISIDTDRAAIFGMEMTLDEVIISRRIATELMGIISSSRVTRLAARYLSESGHNVHYRTLAGMTSLTQEALNSSILRLRVTSYDPGLVVDAANAMAIAFVDTLYEYTGAVYVSVLDYADRISYTGGGNKTMYGAAGATGGGVIGAIIIYIMILSDHRIKTIEDVKRIKGVTRVSIIPLHDIK